MSASHWLTSSEASRYLCVSEKTLSNWRAVGFLKAGKHWKSSPITNLFPWGHTKILYQIDLCEKEINEWWGRKVRSSSHYMHHHRSRIDRHVDQVLLGPFKKSI